MFLQSYRQVEVLVSPIMVIIVPDDSSPKVGFFFKDLLLEICLIT